MSILFSLLAGIPGLLNGLLTYLSKKQDTALEKFRIGNTNGKEVSIAVVQAEIADRQVQKDLIGIGMGHPVWWIGWALFVIPAGMHNFAVHFVSTFHLVWIVDKLPPETIQYDRWIVLSIFGAQVGTGIINKIADAWMKK